MRIFISYRRNSTNAEAGRLYSDLRTEFGLENVFMDVVGIEPGRDFRKVIDEKIGSCEVFLSIIGRDWLESKDDDGQRRLDNPMDFIRLETAAALKRGIRVVPVLVQGAVMPRAEQLPDDMKELAYRHAAELTHDRWLSDLRMLSNSLRPKQQARRLLRKIALVSCIILATSIGVSVYFYRWPGARRNSPQRVTDGEKSPADLKASWQLSSIAFSRDGKFLAAGTYDNKIAVWDLTKNSSAPVAPA